MVKSKGTYIRKRQRNSSYLLAQIEIIQLIQKYWCSDFYKGQFANEGIDFETWIDFQKKELKSELENLKFSKLQKQTDKCKTK